MEDTDSRRWHPAPAIRLSLLLHVFAAVALTVQPALWPWLLSALAANHLLLSGAVFAPRGRLLGPNLVRLPPSAVRRKEIVLTFDDGPDPQVTPQVLDLLDRYGAKASFFCIGRKAAAFPAVIEEIVRRGHSVENHSFGHSHAFALYGIGRLGRDVAASQRTIAAIAGRPPLFFRAPAGFRSPLLDPVLAKHGLRYASWTRRGYDAVEADPAKVLQRLSARLCAGDILLMHDSASRRTQTGQPVVLAVLPLLLEQVAALKLQPVTLPAALRVGEEPASHEPAA